MQFILAVFRSRVEALSYANILSSYKVNVQIINTPRHISVSCGVSVRFLKVHFQIAKDIISRRKFDTFVGFF